MAMSVVRWRSCLLLFLTAASAVGVAGSYSYSEDQSCEGADYSPDPDCTRFWRCANGKAFSFTCPAGLHFNPHINVCDWPENAGCTGKSDHGDWKEDDYYDYSDDYDGYDEDGDYSDEKDDEDPYISYQPPTSRPVYDEDPGRYTPPHKHATSGSYPGHGTGRQGWKGTEGQTHTQTQTQTHAWKGSSSSSSGNTGYHHGGSSGSSHSHGHKGWQASQHNSDYGTDYSNAKHGSSGTGNSGGQGYYGGHRNGGGGGRGGGGGSSLQHSGGGGYHGYTGGSQGNHYSGNSGNFPGGSHIQYNPVSNSRPYGGGNFEAQAGGNYGKPVGGNYGKPVGGNYGKPVGGNYDNYGKPVPGYSGGSGGYNYGGTSFNKQPLPWVPNYQPGFTANSGPVGYVKQPWGGQPFYGSRQPFGGQAVYGKPPLYNQYQPPLTFPGIGGNIYPRPPLPPKPFFGPQPVGKFGAPHILPPVGPGPFVGPQVIGPKPFYGRYPGGGPSVIKKVIVENPVRPNPVTVVKEVTLGKPSVSVSSLGKAFLPVLQKDPQLSSLLGPGGNYLQFNPLAQNQPAQLSDPGWYLGLNGGGGGWMGGGAGWMGGSNNMMMTNPGGSLSKVLLPLKLIDHAASTTTATTTPATTRAATTPTRPVSIFILNPFLPPTLPLPTNPIGPTTVVTTNIPLPRAGGGGWIGDGGSLAARALLANLLQNSGNPGMPASLPNPTGLDPLQFSRDPRTRCRTTYSQQRVTVPILQQSGNALTERKCNALGQLLNSFVSVYLENLVDQSGGGTCVVQVPQVQVLCNTGSSAISPAA
ncbi:uncharacterized protein LOC143287704 [Babylonia areolata]|uniref:uncharacterized protein LOC143287704 n=1 Tax=Babylonia areolata TaxID=304850 RepID=UPI003FD241E3